MTRRRTEFVLDCHTLENMKVITGTDHEDSEHVMLRKRRKAEEKIMTFK